MEQYAFKDLTLEIFRSVLAEEEFRAAPHAAIALQAYLKDAESDVSDLIRWARRTVTENSAKLTRLAAGHSNYRR